MITKLLNKQLKNEGRFGLYFQLNPKTGVKILKSGGFKSLNMNLKSKKNQDLIKEATIGLFANQLTKGIDVFNYNGKFYLGIVQKHFYSKSKEFTPNEIKAVKKEINKNKVVYSDIHDKNLLWNPKTKQIKVIDFQPDYAYFVGDKKEYYRVKNSLIKKLKLKMESK